MPDELPDLATKLAFALTAAGIFDYVDSDIGNEEELVAFIRTFIPPPLPDEVFGFWFRGIWQPVEVGVTVEAVSKDQVTFHYPKPG